MHQDVGCSQMLVEEALIGFELERVRLHARRIRDHAVGGDDGEAFDEEPFNGMQRAATGWLAALDDHLLDADALIRRCGSRSRSAAC